MKPDWKDAPEWANWLAQDLDGTWTWFEIKPYQFTSFWANSISKKGRYLRTGETKWKDSLEERPN